MKSRRQDLILGTVVLMFLGLFVGTIMFVYPSLGGDTNTIVVRFKHDEGVAPLKRGSPVMLSGALQVGQVEEVRKEYAEIKTPAGRERSLLIVVEANIVADLQLYDDCEITTDQPPVGGGGIMVILNVGKSNVMVKGPIKGMPPQSLAAAIGALNRQLLGPDGLVTKIGRLLDDSQAGSLAYKVSQSLSDVNAMTTSLRTQLDSNEKTALMGKVHAIVDNLNQTTAALRAELAADDDAAALARIHVVLETLQQGLSEATGMLKENRPALRGVMTNIESVTDKLDREMMERFKAELNPDDTSSLFGKLHLGLDKLNESLENVVVMTGDGRNMMAVNRPALDRTIENVKVVSDQMRVGVQEIILAPWRLFNEPWTGEVQKVGAFEAARRFAEAATMLDDAAMRLEAIQTAAAENPTAPGSAEEIRAIQAGLKAAFERFEKAEKYLWEQMK